MDNAIDYFWRQMIYFDNLYWKYVYKRDKKQEELNKIKTEIDSLTSYINEYDEERQKYTKLFKEVNNE